METNTQVAIIHNSIEIFKAAPEVLKANQDRTKKRVREWTNPDPRGDVPVHFLKMLS